MITTPKQALLPLQLTIAIAIRVSLVISFDVAAVLKMVTIAVFCRYPSVVLAALNERYQDENEKKAVPVIIKTRIQSLMSVGCEALICANMFKNEKCILHVKCVRYVRNVPCISPKGLQGVERMFLYLQEAPVVS